MKTKKLSVFFLIGLFLLMLFSPETVATGAANGLLLWYRQVLPVLFPFLLITGLMIRTESISLINHTLSPILKPFLGISENASFSVVCGFLCGFPVGAKSCSDLTDKGKISSAEGEYLLSFCNNVSPAFLTGYVAVQSLKQPEMAQICLLFPILAALCCSFLFRRWYLPRNPFAVVETPEGACNQRQTGRQHYYQYTLKGDGEETWHPRFSYYGFRYIQIEGATMQGEHHFPEIHQIKLRHCRILLDSLGYLLIRALIFVFGETFRQLASHSEE